MATLFIFHEVNDGNCRGKAENTNLKDANQIHSLSLLYGSANVVAGRNTPDFQCW